MSEHSSLNPAPSPGLQPGAGAASPRRLDAESKAWLDRLGPDSRERDAAIADLHALLLKARALRGQPPPRGVPSAARRRSRRPRPSERR